MLTAAIADKRHLPLLDSLVHWAGLTLEDNEEMVRQMIRDKANAVVRWTGLDDRLANSVLDGLYRLLAEVLVDPDHPLRRKIGEGLEQLARDLQHDPAMQAKVEGMKNDLLANPALHLGRRQRGRPDKLTAVDRTRSIRPMSRASMPARRCAASDDPSLWARI